MRVSFGKVVHKEDQRFAAWNFESCVWYFAATVGAVTDYCLCAADVPHLPGRIPQVGRLCCLTLVAGR